MRGAGWAILALALLTAALASDVIGRSVERAEPAPLAPELSDPALARPAPKEMLLDGAPCSSCHDGSEKLAGDPRRKGVFHETVETSHGRNQHCFNCHHRTQPGELADYDGSLIRFSRSELLCAKCHGPTFRDWSAGVHGRRSGGWRDPKAAPCLACHDPHSPEFKSMTAAPAPRINPRASESRR